MTATNHALTGAIIALVVKQPELAIPLAFLSHFVLDLIPHYNPPGLTRDNFKNHADSWQRKMRLKSFQRIYIVDMIIFVASLLIVPFSAISDVSAWTIFFSMVAGASPDFFGGVEYLYFLAQGKKPHSSWFDKTHVRLQWMERPWGIYVEIVWFVGALWLINLISK